jgi:ATP-dependent Clp protease protease subunit
MAVIKGEVVAASAEVSIGDGTSRLIHLNRDVEPDSVGPIIEQILRWNEEDDEKDSKQKDFKRKPIKLVVNTYGGYVYDGFALCAVMAESKTPIHTYVYGKAMSMGFLIAASGHKRYASKLSTFMYHSVSGWAWGKIDEMKDQVAEAERLQVEYDKWLLSKTNLRMTDLQPTKDKRTEWYFGAEEALKVGLIDEIL